MIYIKSDIPSQFMMVIGVCPPLLHSTKHYKGEEVKGGYGWEEIFIETLGNHLAQWYHNHVIAVLVFS